jgi:hypothetical protein
MPHDDHRFRHPQRALPAGSAAAPADRARRILVVCAVAVTAGVVGIMALILPAGGDAPDTVAQQMTYPSPWEFVPSPPVSVRPAPSPSPSLSPSPPPAVPGSPQAERRSAPHRTTVAPVVDLNVGATVGLEVAARPGERLRHRDFVGRTDRIGRADRLDAAFVVRKGLGRDGCVSLESVNFPGYFLRHRDFVLRLAERDGSALFADDATFCPSPTRDGTAFVLESINYPSRALTRHRDGVVHLDENSGTAFVVRPPL